MYYSKNGSGTLTVPRNYSGNTFRVIDETERIRTPMKEQPLDHHDTNYENLTVQSHNFSKNTAPIFEDVNQKSSENSLLSSLFQDISVEDILLLSIISVIHQDNSTDPILLLLLILLLAK